jgi:hypothetical protein
VLLVLTPSPQYLPQQLQPLLLLVLVLRVLLPQLQLLLLLRGCCQ